MINTSLNRKGPAQAAVNCNVQQHFIDVCNRHDYWVAPLKENAAVGISLS
jgi:hypothetical protein